MSWRVRLAGSLLLLAAVVPLLALVAFDRAFAGRVLPGVTVAGIDVSGLDPAQLRSRVEAIAVAPRQVEIQAAADRETVAAVDLGLRVHVDSAVDEALAIGRGSGLLGDLPARLDVWQRGHDVPLAVRVDRETLQAWLAARAEAIWQTPMDATISPVDGGWAATPAAAGRRLDVERAIDAIEAALLGGPGQPTVALAVRRVAPAVGDASVAAAMAAAERMARDVPLILGDEGSWTISGQTVASAILFITGSGGPVPIVDPAPLRAALDPISAEVLRAATEPVFLMPKSGTTFGFLPGKAGRALDADATTEAILVVLGARRDAATSGDATVGVVVREIPPETSAAEAADIAPRMRLIGSWTTRYVVGPANGYGVNITLPARIINGTVVQPGQVFDFWAAIGPVTFERGFRMGGVIEGGRTNPQGALAGGICSASTTLFNAAVRGGYEILERHPHSYYIKRYPLGLDATVSKYRSGVAQNLRFRNDTDSPLYIRGTAGSGWVRFQIYSTPTGRSVVFSDPAVSNVRRAVDRPVRTAQLPAGTSRRLEVPSDQMDVVVTRTVRDAAGTIIHRDRFVSHYIKVDGLVLIGTG